MKRIIGFAVLAVCFFSPDAACFAQEKMIAVVNNDVITQRDYETFLNFTRMQLSQELLGDKLEAKIASIRKDLLQRLIEDKLLIQEAKRMKIHIDDARIKGRVNEIKNSYGSAREFQAYLSSQGMTEADLQDKLRDQMLIYELINAAVRSRILIKPREITEFYTSNRDKFFAAEEREFKSVASDSEDKLKGLTDALSRNESLEKAAETLQLTVNSFSAGRGELKKEIDSVVFALAQGEFSKPTKIDDAYYIFIVTRITPGYQQELSQVREEISKLLFDRRLQENVVELLDKLKKKALIRIMEE
jgi:peptidyl-prolyl cis-trans isomerase SurA